MFFNKCGEISAIIFPTTYFVPFSSLLVCPLCIFAALNGMPYFSKVLSIFFLILFVSAFQMHNF